MADYPTLEERGAARKYLEHDHAAQTLDGPAGDAAERNASDIDDEHPRAHDIAATGTSRELGELPKHLKAHQATLRAQAGINTEHAARLRAAYRAGPPDHEPRPEGERSSTPAVRSSSPRRVARSSSSARRSSTSSVRSAASYGSGVLDTIAPATSGWGALIAEIFAWGIGLSLLGLLLGKAAGAANITTGVSSTVKAIVSPHIDPLNPTAKPKSAKSSKPQPTVHLKVGPVPAGAQPRVLNAMANAALGL